MLGILNINKPAGRTSFSVVAQVKRLSGEKRVGHAGTLDPAATGVLPVCLGRATRVIEYLQVATKEYRGVVVLGVTTDTCDAAGKVTATKDASGVTREQFEVALTSFRGEIQQTPPMFSAVRHHGQKLYSLARAGQEVERKSRTAAVHRLDLVDWQPPLATIEVECGKGTYIRTLAHDIGQLLGVGAHLKSLVRTRVGPFRLEDSVTVEGLGEAFASGQWQGLLKPVDIVLGDFPAITLDAVGEESVRKGQPIAAATPQGRRCRAYAADGHFLAVLTYEVESATWRPEKVFG